jgi:hypothetical protein
VAPVTIKTSALGWREDSSTVYWTAKVLHDTGTALYAVVQDSGATPKVRVMKADSRTAPSSWTEQDSANNKTTSSVFNPYTSWYDATGGMIHVIVGTAAGLTLTHYRYNTATDLWTTGHGTVTTAAAASRSIRCCVRTDGDVLVFFTSSADTADAGYFIWQGANWTTGSVTGIFSGNSTGGSVIIDAGIDSTDRAWVVYYEPVNGRYHYRTINSANTVAAQVTVDTDGSTDTTAPAGGRFNMYVDGTTDKIYAAYLGGFSLEVDERVLTLESDANAANVSAETIIEATAADKGARTPVSTAVISSGTPYAAWWDDASSGTIKYSTKSGGSWAAETNFATSITRLVEIVPVSTGLVVVYQSGSDVIMDFIVAAAVGATGTVSSGTLSVSGQSITGTFVANATGTVATGSLAVSGQAIAGTPTVAGNVATGSHTVAGQAVAATTGVVGTVGTGSLAVSAQSISATTGVVAAIATGSHSVVGQSIAGTAGVATGDTGTVATGSHTVAGQAISVTVSVTGAVATGSHAISGQAVAATTGVVATLATGSHTVTGQTVTAATGVTAAVGTGTHTVTGQTITSTTGTTGSIGTGSLSITGQAIAATYNTTGAIATGSLIVTGQAIASTTGVGATVTTGSLNVSGQAIEGSAGVAGTETGTVSSGTYAVTGQTVSGSTGTNATITTGNLGVTGQQIDATTGTVAAIGTGSHAVTGHTIEGSTTSGTTTGTIATGVLLIDGQTVVSGTSATVILATGTYAVSGQTITVTIIGTGDVEGHLQVNQPLTATIVVTQTMTARTTTSTTLGAQTTIDTTISGYTRDALTLSGRLEQNYG